MTTFFEDIKKYEDVAPVGVRLPEINIEDKYYEQLGEDKSISNFDFLKSLCRKGIKDLGIDKFENKKDYYDRAKTELDILEDLGFTDYILLNWDILNFCQEEGIPTGAGRGSAAGSLVLFLIGVTKIDSIKYDLYFERFVSKNRAKKTVKDGITFLDGSLLADIDNDIDYKQRQKVIDYIEQRHPERTCRILTLNTLSSKLCIKECGKIVGGMSESDVNDISTLIPKIHGKVHEISKAIEESERFGNWAAENPKVIKIAKKIQNLNKNAGVHPSGIAISWYKIHDICPMKKTSDGHLVTGYDMNWVSELMVKFDILGLRTLTVVYDVCNMLGIDPVKDIPIDSKEIYDHLQNLEQPHGIFQLEAEANHRVSKKTKARDLNELAATVAIARPGAMDYLDDYGKYRDTGEFESVHPLYDDILKNTAGIPIFQEELMQMAVKVGFTLDDAEMLRRIVGKKKVDEIPKWKKKIEEKIKENNLPTEAGEALWKTAEDSASYSFNKCLLPETVVESEDGLKCMSEIRIGDNILSYDVDNNKDHFVEVKNIYENEVEVYEVLMEDGTKISCSMDHKFLCSDKKMHTLRDILEKDLEIFNQENTKIY